MTIRRNSANKRDLFGMVSENVTISKVGKVTNPTFGFEQKVTAIAGQLDFPESPGRLW